jgi:hypothetical protein
MTIAFKTLMRRKEEGSEVYASNVSLSISHVPRASVGHLSTTLQHDQHVKHAWHSAESHALTMYHLFKSIYLHATSKEGT